jgi:hypothetical protein
MIVLFSIIFAIGAWIALWASDESKDGLMILGISICCITIFFASLI